MTYYDMLGVSQHASQEEIRAAYRELARQNHPDRFPDADPALKAQVEENIKAINAAYDTLGNPDKRRRYHDVMWTRHDPARKYRFRHPNHHKPGIKNERQAETRPNPSAAIILEIQQLRRDRDNLVMQQSVKQRRLWMSAGLTSLFVFLGMSFRAGLESAPQQAGLVFLFFIGLEIIALNIIINASGMSEVRGANFSSPVFFALSVSVGFIILFTTTFLGELSLAKLPTTYSGIVISAALGVHVFGASRLAHMQDVLFKAQRKAIQDQIKRLELKLGQVKSQTKNEN
jgi:hypothetical protein